MERNEVKSEMIKSVGYDAATKTLEVEFRPRKEGEPTKVYQYAGVEPDVHKAFVGAQSLARFFSVAIRPCFECKRIEEKDAATEKKGKTINAEEAAKIKTPF